MSAAAEKIYIVFVADDREEEVDLTPLVNDMMTLMQPLTSTMSPMLLNHVREGAIIRAARIIIRAQQERGHISSPWLIRRMTPPSA